MRVVSNSRLRTFLILASFCYSWVLAPGDTDLPMYIYFGLQMVTLGNNVAPFHGFDLLNSFINVVLLFAWLSLFASALMVRTRIYLSSACLMILLLSLALPIFWNGHQSPWSVFTMLPFLVCLVMVAKQVFKARIATFGAVDCQN